MPALLADVHSEGHLEAILAVCRSPDWAYVWHDLAVGVPRLSDLGLTPEVTDDVLWRACQEHDLILVTSSRNREGSQSLQETIERESTASSLPVLTLADATRLSADRAYCRDAAVRMMEILLDLDRTRGSGRLWLP